MGSKSVAGHYPSKVWSVFSEEPKVVGCIASPSGNKNDVCVAKYSKSYPLAIPLEMPLGLTIEQKAPSHIGLV